MINAHTDPPGIAGEIVDPVGDCLAALGNEEVMHADRRRPAGRSPLGASVLEVADQLLLLRIDRDDWLGGGLAAADLLVDVAKLGVPIRMLGPSRVLRFACRLYPAAASSSLTS